MVVLDHRETRGGEANWGNVTFFRAFKPCWLWPLAGERGGKPPSLPSSYMTAPPLLICAPSPHPSAGDARNASIH